jgi:hypothetical protein
VRGSLLRGAEAVMRIYLEVLATIISLLGAYLALAHIAV